MQISKQLAHEGGTVVSPTHRPPLPPRKYSWYSILLEAELIPGPAGRTMSIKIPVTLYGIKPVTFWIVVQCLDQLRQCVSPLINK
jgi:hypothetical protein